MSELIQFEGCTVAVLAPEDLEELERDAKRYRFLRDEEYPEPLLLMLREAGIRQSLVDASVDGAIAAREDRP